MTAMNMTRQMFIVIHSGFCNVYNVYINCDNRDEFIANLKAMSKTVELLKKNFKEPTRPKAKKLGAQHVKC